MPANRKPKAWNLKPQLTAAPELWKNCTAAWGFWEGTGGSMDLVSKTMGSPFVEGGAWGVSESGRVFDTTSGGAFDTGLFGRDIFTENKNTIICAFSDFSTNTSIFTNIVIAARDGWNSGTLVQWGWTAKGTKTNEWVNINPSGSGFIPDDLTDIASGPQVVTFRNDGTNFSVRRNGKNIGSVTDPGFNSGASPNRPVTLGGSKNFGSWGEHAHLKFSVVYVYSDVLPDSDIAKLERDPFAMLRPAGF